MEKGRLEAFSDGVIAVIITIMVLDLKAPHGATVAALLPIALPFFVYVISFIFVGIYWNNHHHLLTTAHHVNGRIMWLNLHLLFWLSLVPFVTAWVAQYPLRTIPTAIYGLALLLSGVAYFALQHAIVNDPSQGCELREALGEDLKGKLSPTLYIVAIAAAFYNPIISYGIYIAVAVMWFLPDTRIERRALDRHLEDH